MIRLATSRNISRYDTDLRDTTFVNLLSSFLFIIVFLEFSNCTGIFLSLSLSLLKKPSVVVVSLYFHTVGFPYKHGFKSVTVLLCLLWASSNCVKVSRMSHHTQFSREISNRDCSVTKMLGQC